MFDVFQAISYIFVWHTSRNRCPKSFKYGERRIYQQSFCDFQFGYYWDLWAAFLALFTTKEPVGCGRATGGEISCTLSVASLDQSFSKQLQAVTV
jgi:hypothetical protein